MRNKHGDVQWYLPHKKRPFTESTVCESNTIEAFAEDGLTWNQMLNALAFESKEKEIIRVFIENGYGNRIAKEMLNNINA